jgi:ATP-dependent DNA helicase RecG
VPVGWAAKERTDKPAEGGRGPRYRAGARCGNPSEPAPRLGHVDVRTWLGAPVARVEGVSARAAATLGRALEIHTVRDLLEHYPAQGPGKYRDIGARIPLAEAPLGEPVTLVGTLSQWTVARPRRQKLTIAKTKLVDEAGGGRVEIALFNQEWRSRQLPPGSRVAASGVLEMFRGTRQLRNARIALLGETLDFDDVDRIRATYPATEAMPSARIAGYVRSALDATPTLPDHLPAALLERRDLPSLDWALRSIHRPAELAEVRPARDRLVYDELLCLQLGLQQRRHRLESDAVGLAQPPVAGGLAGRFLDGLPFEPTAAQRRAFAEVGADLDRPKPMHRLLQGDVGTGKTLVAAWMMLCAADHARQAVLMAPTEILAEQHFRNLTALMGPLGVNAPGGPRLELVTGGMPKTRLRSVLAGLIAGDVHLLVGTHALLEERVGFADLGVVVVDEQHRFGVEHRTRLRDKRSDGRTPDVLVMTATPIPRSLALTLYGDLDVTVLDQRPTELDVRTVVLPSDSPRRAKLHDYIRDRVAHGQRAYVVCPLVEESEALDVANAIDVHRRLSEEVFPDLDVGLVHGRMPSSERDHTMEAFRRGDVQVLVATTVIEVGVDVREATVMVIEDADRFGISQLHQLRGRLYRGVDGNYCVLFSRSPEENPRLEAVAATNDGFKLAEVDLELRGEGSLFDTRQSGLPDLRLAKLVRDYDWVAASREDARAIVEDDPRLDRHPDLLAEVRRRYGDERLAALETG